MKNKAIIIILSIIILLLLATVLLLLIPKNIFITKQADFSMIENKTYNPGDSITEDELKTNFEKIYNNHTSLGLSLTNSFENCEFPYITTANISENNDEIIVYFSPELSKTKINYSAFYNKNNGDLQSLLINCENINNEMEFNVIVGIASNKIIIGDTIDMNISNGIQGALSDESKEFKYVYNKYKDIAWIVKKDKMTIDDKIITTFYINKKR